MTESLRIPHSLWRSRVDWGNWKRYLGLGLIFNAAIWGTALLYLEIAPREYSSEWTIALPRGGEQASVSVPGVGSASSSIQSPYNTNNADPREDYRYIASSKPVLEAAAASLELSLGEFGSPRINIVPNTMLMEFEFEGDSPREAQFKSQALYEALLVRLYELRIQEAAHKEQSLQTTLKASQKKLNDAQQRLSDYKSRSDFNSDVQIDHLSSSIEQLRRERAQTLAQLRQSDASLRQLSTSLELSPQQATEAYKLQSDPYLQQITSDYGESSAAIVGLNSRYTPENPAVINEKSRQEDIQAALTQRSQYLLKKPVSQEYVEQLSLNNSPSREQLLQNLVSVQADKQGLQARAQEIEQQLVLFENRLKSLAKQQITVVELQRQLQIAEVIFSSTLTQLDLRNSDVFGSYPQIQLIQEPSLPNSPNSPKEKFVLLGAILGSSFLTLAVASLWYRSYRASLPKQVEPIYSKLAMLMLLPTD